ncbi:hypothetical protein ACFWFS_00230 [Streptomyces albidoflavus]
MKTYPTIDELLTREGPALQDYVSADELDQLLNGTLPHGVIADRYIDDLIKTNLAAVETGAQETRSDLLSWIRNELDCAAVQRREMAREDEQQLKLDMLRKIAAAEQRLTDRAALRKAELVEEALAAGALKASIANALDISRPTLDRLIAQQRDRALLNDAIFTLIRRGMGSAEQARLSAALGIRDTSGQASTLLAALEVHPVEGLTPEERSLMNAAEKRARELV